MYTADEFRNVEPVCYEHEHIEKVLKVVRESFYEYFDGFIETEGGKGVSSEELKALQEKFGTSSERRKDNRVNSKNYKRIIADGIEEFEKDRASYDNIFSMELLEEYAEDSSTFKSEILHNKCPIIRKTLANKNAKELKKYRHDFNIASADYLLHTVTNLCKFSNEYMQTVYKSINYDGIE